MGHVTVLDLRYVPVILGSFREDITEVFGRHTHVSSKVLVKPALSKSGIEFPAEPEEADIMRI